MGGLSVERALTEDEHQILESCGFGGYSIDVSNCDERLFCLLIRTMRGWLWESGDEKFRRFVQTQRRARGKAE